MTEAVAWSGACPVPVASDVAIQLAHGGGGRLTRQLIERMFLPAFDHPALRALHDGAVLELHGVRLALTTDSYVVHPWQFPGGDIGSLAVHGTVNDLAMCGARPLWLSTGFILEEGFPMESLSQVTCSMREAARASGVDVVTGDTKVVDKGKGDGIFINTAGVGVLEHGQIIGPASLRPGDALLLSGDIGRHGVAIMAVREGLAFESTIESDSAPLAQPVLALLAAGLEVHCLRDLTRGGLATALVELATGSGLHLHIDERQVPVNEEVRGACEVLGLDPFYVANEGRFLIVVPGDRAERALAVLRRSPVCGQAVRIGSVEAAPAGRVTMTSVLGSARLLELLSGEQLPRIC